MSRYVVGTIAYEDLSLLCETLEDIFGLGSVIRVEGGENRMVAHNYQGDSREREIGKVAAVVRRDKIGVASNDIAIRKEIDGTYRLIVSEYDQMVLAGRLRVLATRKGGPQGVVAQRYGVAQVRKKFKAMGYTLEVKEEVNGVVRVVGTSASSKWA